MTGEKGDTSKKPEGETIDANSPFYIHPSDYPKQMQVNDMLNDNNYNEWKQEMTNFLLAKNKMRLIDDTIKKPENESQTHTAWVRADAMVKGWLTTAMEKEIRTNVRYANTSSEIWKDLGERFEKEGAPRAYELKQLINVTRQGGMSVSNYYTKLRSLWDEIQVVLPLPRCECAIGKQLNEVKEKERTYEFLMGLDDEFSVIRTQAINKATPKPTITDNEKKEKCSFCQREGHVKEGCFKLIGYPEWWRGNRDKGVPKAACVEAIPSPISGLTDEQYQLFVKHFKESGSITKTESQPRANMAGRIDTYDGWVVDTGATEHMIHRSDFLNNKTQSPKGTPVIIPNGDKIPVLGEGDHILPGGIKIKGVLLVPNFNYNLLSVGKLADELNCVVTFFPGFFVMQELGTKRLIGAGNRIEGLYRMGVVKTNKALLTTFETWHKRLGHPSPKKVSRLDFVPSCKNDLNCDACFKAKHTTVSY
ncbi:uncharacterized protein LOC111903801 [Lactuca sativa]|uniref:uncharacterized protein LOC111903801 n=1 Tax=Lactuca sativa TaxID=4236 RepID=UPI000CD9EAED|nr:uncharacterized protein LOC111903801 [Lactuca sativa]